MEQFRRAQRTDRTRRVPHVLVAMATLLSVLTIVVSSSVPDGTAEAGVFFNDTEFTYKEYWADHSTYTAGCHGSEVDGNSFYIEPDGCLKEINLEIGDDVQGAIAAVIYVDLWRNRLSKTARFTVNDGPQYRPPEGSNFSRTVFQATVPLEQLQVGANSLKFQEATGPYHVHDVMIRVYYDEQNQIVPGPNSDTAPPSGELLTVRTPGAPVIDPGVGGTLNVDGNQVELTASAVGAKYVEFHAYYEGFDEDNDGVTLEWHNYLRNNFGPGGTAQRANGATIGHIFTDGNPNSNGVYEATWNLPEVVSQSGVKFKIRVVDAQGNVREAAGGVSADFTLQRSYSVETYTIPNFPDQALFFDGSFPQVASLEIPLPTDLVVEDIDRAILLGSYWENPDISLNDTPPFRAFEGAEDTWDTSQREIDPMLLKPGLNSIRWAYRPPGFGAMIESPGPMVVIHRNVPSGPPVITVAPDDVLISPGQSATFTVAASGAPLLQYQWLQDGVPIVGATSATYTTPALLSSDDGSKFSVTVTNGEGSVTSAEGTAFVATALDESTPWWNTGWDYRVPITVFPEGVERTDKIVERQLNFSELMAAAGAGGPSFDANSIRVVEVDDNGAVINAAVPFQFDPDNNYDPISNAIGEVLWQVTGVTSAGEGRSYHIYFDKTYKNIPAATVTPQIVRTDVIDEGFEAYQFDLADGSEWVFHAEDGGGFSKIIDDQGADWVQWNDAPKSQGDFRGTPNAVKPPAGYFHPGRRNRTNTTIVYEGPLRITMEVRAFDNSWISVWEMYPTYGEFFMTRANKRFWYLYEGLPGGEIDANDYIQRADGVQIPIDGTFESDLPGEEWMYFADPTDNRSLYIAHAQDDGAVESYRLLNKDEDVQFQLPVLAFGRGGLDLNFQYLRRLEDGEPQKFTTGLAKSTDFTTTRDHIRDAYNEVQLTVGAAEFNGVNSGAQSDDFSSATLDPVWTFTDPVGDTTMSFTGSNLQIDIPEGASHDLWTGRDFAPRLLQNVGDDDLDVVAAFGSLPAEAFQGQGLIFVEDDDNWIRAFVEHEGTRSRYVVYQMVDGIASQVVKKNLPGVATRFIRAIRTGDTWSFQRSYNGSRWFSFKETYDLPLTVNQLGVAGITHNPNSTDPAPAFVLDVDYFESKTSGEINDDAPQISNIQIDASARSATVSWDTSVPADTRLDHGPNIDLGNIDVITDETLTHEVFVDFLQCNTPYFVQPRSTSAIGSDISDVITFTTDACPTIVSDDLSTGTLGAHWTLFDPVGDTSLSLSDTNAVISVPAGVEHNLFTDENQATRLRQEGPVGDFGVEAKFESVLTTKFQTQGIVVEEDEDSFLRFELHHNGTEVKALMASILDGAYTTHHYSTVVGQYLRVTRSGNEWTMFHSGDGVSWTSLGSMVVGLESAYVGPYVGNTNTGRGVPPAFLGSIDYFFNIDNPITPEDGGAGPDVTAPVVSNVSATVAVPTQQSATINWTTNEPSTTRIEWGFTAQYGAGPLVINEAVTNHEVVIEPLVCNTTYHYRVFSNDASGNTGQSGNRTFDTPACPPGAFSDNFDAPTLDSRWLVDDPRQDGVLEQPSGLLSLSVPPGVRHDLTNTNNGAMRVLQPVPNENLQVTVGFESVVNFRQQLQGIIFEEDDDNLIRFDISYGANGPIAFVGTLTSGPVKLTQKAVVPIDNSAPVTLRATRSGTQTGPNAGTDWLFEYSPDRGTTWFNVWQGTLDFDVARVGPFVGNAHPQVANIPGHTALVDYFLVASDPITITEPGALEAPQFTIFGGTGPIWDGNPMKFGQVGLSQPDINVRGRVSDLDGIANITYQVNGGQPVTMGLGSTDCDEGTSCTRRLARNGDFNADVDSALLNPGINNVTIRAVDNEFNAAEITVPIDYTPPQPWPLPYSVDWSTVTDLYDVSQPVDGRWVTNGDTVRVEEPGYDRLLTFGDNNWSSFEAETTITIHGIDEGGYNDISGGPGVGFIPHWRGHTQVSTVQPKYGFNDQIGALVWYRYRDDVNGQRFEIRDSNAVLVAEDLSGRTLNFETEYTFKMQAETEPGDGAGPIYRLKVWEVGTTEPEGWDIVTALGSDAPDTGSLVLVAHHVDADFGDLVVREIQATEPVVTPGQGVYTGIAKIEMTTETRAAEIRYTLDGSEPDENSLLFTEPFFVNESTTITAKTIREGFVSSDSVQQVYSILPPDDRIEDELQAIYRFDDDSGNVVADTALVDAQNPYDLIIEPGSDVTWLPDVDALRINGPSLLHTATGVSRLNEEVQNNREFTVEAWIDPSTLDLSDGTIFNIGNENPNAQNIEITQQGRTLDLQLRTSAQGGDGSLRNTGSIVPPQLHHVVYQRASDNIERVYIDGLLAYQTQRSGSLFNWSNGYGISVGNSQENNNPWVGDLYLLAVYSKALSTAEIQTNYQSGPFPPPANFAPIVDAGSDITLVQGEVAQMAATSFDDGNPDPPSTFTTTWSQISGPATAVFSDPNSPTTTVQVPAAGTYILRWTGDDTEKVTTDDLQIDVIPAGSQAPAPSIDPTTGSYPGQVQVDIATTVPGGIIRYTIDGSDPTATSPVYTAPFTITETATVKAYVVRTNLQDSDITVRNYLVTPDSRVTDNLVLFYPFNEENGSTIKEKGPLPNPLNLTIENIGKTTRVGSGVRIDQPTLIKSTASASKISSRVKQSGEVTVELWVQPEDVLQDDSMMFGLSANRNARNLAIFQEADDIDVFMRSKATNTRGEPPTSVADQLEVDMMHLVYTRDSSGIAKIYVNGFEVADSVVGNTLANWITTHRLHLGGERDGTRSWLGTYFLLAMYDRALTPSEVVQNFAFGDV